MQADQDWLESARYTRHMTLITSLTSTALLVPLALACSLTPVGDWSRDPAWFQGKAEWALYDAKRVIYGKERTYEATIFTNTQLMNPATTTKSDQNVTDAIEVFKLNISEQIPTENYVYRFLTTSFVNRSNLDLYKLTTSTQEDCGSTYRHFVSDGNDVQYNQYNYFPGPGHLSGKLKEADQLTFFNALPLTLRNFSFPKDGSTQPTMNVTLIADQTTTRSSDNKPQRATITYNGRVRITVPIGTLWTHHLSLTLDDNTHQQPIQFWMAEDARHVMVQYRNPDGTSYALKRLAWWAYWRDAQPPSNEDLLGHR